MCGNLVTAKGSIGGESVEERNWTRHSKTREWREQLMGEALKFVIHDASAASSVAAAVTNAEEKWLLRTYKEKGEG